jgi:hypothetical protein
VRKGLGEIAELALSLGIVFLGEQSDIVSYLQEPFEQVRRLVVAAIAGEGVNEPE